METESTGVVAIRRSDLMRVRELVESLGAYDRLAALDVKTVDMPPYIEGNLVGSRGPIRKVREYKYQEFYDILGVPYGR